MAKIIDKTELVMYRKDFLRQMDDYVKDMIGDETITQEWLSNGLPDGYDDIDLEEIWSTTQRAHCSSRAPSPTPDLISSYHLPAP